MARAPVDEDLAQALALQRRLEAGGHGCAVRWLERTGSTNSDLLAQLRTEAVAPQCLVTGHQSAGRGRRARAWLDEGADHDAAALLCSLAWPLPRGCDLSGLSLAVGVWLVQGLQALGLSGATLKWPNDLLLDERKLAGVLIEVADLPQARWVVVGIGLNLRAPAGLAQASGLAEHGIAADRWQVLGEVLPRLLIGLQEFARDGFAPWMERWNQLHAWSQRRVRVLGEAAPLLEGRAVGVDAQGYLWLQTEHGRQRVSSGDVSLRSEPD